MGNKISNRKPAVRRLATVSAALGMLLMSSGIALMVAATPANAAVVDAVKVGVCHATSSDTNPYVYLLVDDDSTKLQGHLQHKNFPNKTWKSDLTYEGVDYKAGDPKPDFIDVAPTACDGDVEQPPSEAVADVDFTDAACVEGEVGFHAVNGSFDETGDNVTWGEVGSTGPGESITITATATGDSTFNDDSTSKEFKFTFSDLAGTPCNVAPPSVAGDPTFVDPTCDTDGTVVLPAADPVPERKSASASDLSGDVNGFHYAVAGGLAAGDTVTVDATAIPPNTGEAAHWEHTFTTPTDCGSVLPPVVAPPEDTTVVATPTLVHAGLTGAPVAKDLRGEQGLALLVAGMILMVAAGGLGLVRPGGKTRS